MTSYTILQQYPQRMRPKRRHSELFGSLFIKLNIPCSSKLIFSLPNYWIQELYSRQKAYFNLQIFIIKDFPVVQVSSFVHNPVYSRFNTKHGYVPLLDVKIKKNRFLSSEIFVRENETFEKMRSKFLSKFAKRKLWTKFVQLCSFIFANFVQQNFRFAGNPKCTQYVPRLTYRVL